MLLAKWRIRSQNHFPLLRQVYCRISVCGGTQSAIVHIWDSLRRVESGSGFWFAVWQAAYSVQAFYWSGGTFKKRERARTHYIISLVQCEMVSLATLKDKRTFWAYCATCVNIYLPWSESNLSPDQSMFWVEVQLKSKYEMTFLGRFYNSPTLYW